MNIEQLKQIKNQATLLHDSKVIEAALNRLSLQLTSDYADKKPLFLVVMNGGLIFSGNLLTRLNFPAQIDYCHATRYRGNTSGGKIEWKATTTIDLNERHVIIIDDILDEGYTLKAIIEDCWSKNAASVKSCVLIEKLHKRKAIENMKPDYCELQTDDHYVFGYGMDFNHYWRNTNEIYIYNPEAATVE